MSMVPRCRDSIIQNKDSSGNHHVIYPITRYHTMLCAPSVISKEEEDNGAPFTLLKSEETQITPTYVKY